MISGSGRVTRWGTCLTPSSRTRGRRAWTGCGGCCRCRCCWCPRVVALFVADRQHTWARFELGLPAGGRGGRLVGGRDGAGPPGRLHRVAAHGVRGTHRAGRVPGLGQPPLWDIRLYRVPARVRAGQPVAGRRLRGHRAGGVRGNGRRLPVGERGADGYLPGSGRGAGGADHELGQHHQPGAGAESRAGPDDQRTGRGEPPAGSLDGRECRTARPAGDPGPGGGHRRGAAAPGRRDPRHPGPGPHRDHRPARSGRAHPAPPGHVAPPRRPGPGPGPRQPHRGPALGARAASRAARARPACPRRSARWRAPGRRGR